MIDLKPHLTIDYRDHAAVGRLFIDRPLSGYLAGQDRGGFYVRELESRWSTTFKVKHAIAVNSATSGLMAAAFAVGLKPGDQFVCPAMTMSATAAAPMFTGATPFIVDVEDTTFSLDTVDLPYDMPVFVTNLFGHPARLRKLRQWCDLNHTVLIEDNAQSPFAWERDVGYAGTVGDIGVFSLNVHKPLQCGEGGVVVTNDDILAERLRAFINHGEHSSMEIGLNLRMPEICAAIGLTQLGRGEEIIQGRIDQAKTILATIGEVPGIRMPITRRGCRHVYYTIPFLVDDNREEFIVVLRSLGVPVVCGYVDPLYRMPAFAEFKRECPIAEELHDDRLFYFENCQYDVTPQQAEQIGEAFRKAARAAL